MNAREVLVWTVVVIVLGVLTLNAFRAGDMRREVAEAKSVYDIDLPKRDAEREGQTVADIAACSAVVDPIRCQQAFRCLQAPELCVFEHGEAGAVVAEYHDRQLVEADAERALSR